MDETTNLTNDVSKYTTKNKQHEDELKLISADFSNLENRLKISDNKVMAQDDQVKELDRIKDDQEI